MSIQKILLTSFAAACFLTLGPAPATSDLPCFMCHETCVITMEECYADEKCEGDYCEATLEEKICSNID